jgi:alpha-L-fucosidase
MKRREIIRQLALGVPAIALGNQLNAQGLFGPRNETIQSGPFKPNWQSLSEFKVPEWFSKAKFGIWAHWGPQCEPEAGDWYARSMYIEGGGQYNLHLKKYGHPSKVGFKDVINQWKAESWKPDELLALYKKAGAKYFMALANHHDNFDLYDSRYQKNWNATKIGPKKDLIRGCQQAAKKQGLYFGLSVHAAHAWSWYETSQHADKVGPYAGIPYDGKLTKADGRGQWWEGLDPQELYAQNHALSENSADPAMIHKQWNWGNGVTMPSKAYCEKFFNRTIDLINSYDPDLVYFDDTALPLWPVSDVGLKIAAHLYNRSIKKKGKQNAVVFGKILDELQRKCMVWDIERGQSNKIEPLPWQTDTCIGSWHYNRSIYDSRKYKTAKTVVHILADVVSKNGNLLLSVPVRGNGSIDELEQAIVEEIGEWMAVNNEAIYDSRPWLVYGEGPQIETAAPLSRQGFNEGKGAPFTSADIRFTEKDNAVYAIVMEWPDNGPVILKSFKQGSQLYKKTIEKISLLGSPQEISFNQDQEGLHINLPGKMPKLSYASVLKIV